MPTAHLAIHLLPVFSGNDQFRYIAGNGNLPNNDAIVTISVGGSPVATADSYNVVGMRFHYTQQCCRGFSQ